jgi:hypothetical protein
MRRLKVGGELNISEITVKAHRGQMMRKMKADSLADLVNMAARLRLARSPEDRHSSANAALRITLRSCSRYRGFPTT